MCCVFTWIYACEPKFMQLSIHTSTYILPFPLFFQFLVSVFSEIQTNSTCRLFNCGQQKNYIQDNGLLHNLVMFQGRFWMSSAQGISQAFLCQTLCTSFAQYVSLAVPVWLLVALHPWKPIATLKPPLEALSILVEKAFCEV